MSQAIPLTAGFSDLVAPMRATTNEPHRLTDILPIATYTAIAGAEGWEQVAEYGRREEAFLRRFVALPGGIPG